MRLAFNASAYDALASGAKARTVGLTAALLRAGHAVRLFTPKGLSLRADVEFEHEAPVPADRFAEIETPLDPSSPLRRAVESRRWFERNMPRDVDVFVTDYYPVVSAVPTLVTIHDLRYFAAPQFEPTRRVAWFRAFYPRMARRAACVVVPTQAVAAEARTFLGLDAGRVAVVANGLSRAWREATSGDGARRHLLMIGFAERRKDLATVLAAIRRAPTAPPLVVVGRGRPPRGADDLVAAGRAKFVGDVDDAAIVRLCRSATALVHPSRYEGFGLPVIEAMSVGTPVVAARCAAVDEIAGGRATSLPPGDVEAWAAAIASPAQVRRDARDRAHSFTWDAAANSLVVCAECVAFRR